MYTVYMQIFLCMLKLSDMFTVCEVWPMLYTTTMLMSEVYIVDYC